MKGKAQAKNPITGLDYPDVDVIRVGEIYYMVSTTMHFMPGCEILRSYDLVNWEHASYVYDVLDSTSGQCLEGESNIYGRGMWAATLRYHKGVFYVCFVANDTQKTYLFTAPSVKGPWKKQVVEGFYHDCSILFDDDDKVYMVYGNKHIYLTQMEEDLSGPKPGGLHRMVVSDEGHPGLGYEGAHFYKIHGKYYLFFIHSLRTEWKRVEACFISESLEGEFVGGDVLNDDMGYRNSGVAQGGIVDTPDGDWYAILFQDRGASGRLPVLLPISWEKDYPVFGKNGQIPKEFVVTSYNSEYPYEPLVQSDDFKKGRIFKGRAYATDRVCEDATYDSYGFKSCWQFNHEPDFSLIQRNMEDGLVEVITDKLCNNLTQAKNILTQRMFSPKCAGEIRVNAVHLKDGDFAGICALQGCYGAVALTKEAGKTYAVMMRKPEENNTSMGKTVDLLVPVIWEKRLVESDDICFRLEVDFTDGKDEAQFSLNTGEGWETFGPVHKLFFRLDHFTGCRFGLFVYSTKEPGGKGVFSDFVYKV